MKTLKAAILGSIAVSLVHLHAALQIPYSPDPSTLHLWHLDEPSGNFAFDATTQNPITLTNLGAPVGGNLVYTNTSFGSPSFPGLGTSVSGSTKVHLLYGGAFTDVTEFANPETGAFTFEAAVKFDIDPLGAIDAEIVSGDNGQGITARGWQFRVFNGTLEWDLLAGSTDNDFKANLPATGPNAAIAGAWYHVAVTYSGFNPTNGDAPNMIKLYWTLLDPNRIQADVLGEYTATRPLDGSPQGFAQPSLGVGGSARNITGNPGNNEGLIGNIDEVRISSVARAANEMAFAAGGAVNPPTLTTEPPAETRVNFGQTLTLAALVSGTPPLDYQWWHAGASVSGQNQTTLVLSDATFALDGDYQLVVSNSAGSVTSRVAHVTVGAGANGLFATGTRTNRIIFNQGYETAVSDWILARSEDLLYLGPDALVFENSFPLQFVSPNGSFSPTNGISMWIGAGGNPGGAPATSPAGDYIYRARFLLNTADPSTVQVSGNLWANGSIRDILVNGQSTGIALNPGGTLYVTTFALTNGFVAGWNTIDFVENLGGAGISAIRVEPKSSGLALPPGPPSILDQPSDEKVRGGSAVSPSQARFSVVALGRPPLTYQWLSGSSPIAGATNRTLTFDNPGLTSPGQNFSVIVRNDSGSVTSRVATLTIAPANQPPVPAPIHLVSFGSGSARVPISDLIQKATDPDHDPIAFLFSDPGSAAGAFIDQPNGTLIYNPVEGFTGLDQFNYSIIDQTGSDDQSANGTVHILVLAPSSGQTVAPGATATLRSGVSTIPAGYMFRWRLNGTNLVNATSTDLTIQNAQLANAGSYTLAVTDPTGTVWTSPGVGLTVGTPGTGTGLIGDYYSDQAGGATNFNVAPTLTRIDPNIDFNWGTDSPDPLISFDGFVVRWHGQVQPLYSETYTFFTTTDDGARLWVNGQLLIDRWQNQAATTFSGTIDLQAGRKYSLVMEYYENTSSASAQLSWSSLHQPRQVIPSTQLYPTDAVPAPTLTVTVVNPTTLSLNWSGTFTLETATDIHGSWTAVATSITGPRTVSIGTEPHRFYRLSAP